MEPFAGQLPHRENIVIPDDQVTPEMRANALGSPDNVHFGALKPEAVQPAEQEPTPVAGLAGTVAVNSAIEAAAYRPNKRELTEGEKVRQKADQQMGVLSAIRKLNESSDS